MITILAGNVVINKYGYRLTETGDKNNMTVNGSGSDFVCTTDDNDTDTLTFDVKIPAQCDDDGDPLCSILDRYDRLFNVIRMANMNNGHLQYRWMSDKCSRIYELIGGSLNKKDMTFMYSGGRVPPFLSAELQLNVRKNEQPLFQLFPVHAPIANSATGTAFSTLWGGTVSALLVGPATTAVAQARTATTLGAFTTLDEISNAGYTRLTLTAKEVVSSVLWPAQPIASLLPRTQHATDRVAVTCADLVWLSIAAGTHITAIVIADASDRVLAVIPYTNWWFGDAYHTSYIVPDGGLVKFKVNQLGLIVAP